MSQYPAGVTEPVGERITAHPCGHDPCHLGGYIRRNGQKLSRVTVIETKGPFLQLLIQPQGHDLLKFQGWRYDPPESPEFKNPLDLPLDIADLVGLLGKEITHTLRQGGFYGIGIFHYGVAF